jgi:integrase
MIDYTFSGVKVALTRKIKKSDLGKAQPVYWRVTFKRKQVYYYTGLKYHDSEWDDFINRKLQKHKETKVDIKVYFENNIKPIIKDLVLNSSFSFEAFEAMLYNQNSNSTVNNAFENKITSLEENNKIGNASIYISTLKALMRFKHYSLIKRKVDKQKFIETCIEKKHITTGKDILVVEEEISFDEITPKFLNECEKFWEATEVSFATMGIYMRTLRAIINNKDGDKPFLEGDKYPFGINGKKYEIPEGGRRDIAMPIDDIWKIENFKTDNEALSVARDIFVFMFYCNGLNFGDLCRLTYKNIDAPRKEIIFERKKTLRKGEEPTFIYVPILPPMIEIINRRGNENQDEYIFPFLNGIEPTEDNEKLIKRETRLKLEPINSSLKYIANELDLDPNISTSYTRNSYITHLTSELLINPIVVKKMVGHSTKKDVTAGYVKLTPKKRREINMKLVNPERKYNTINSKVTTG